MTNKELPKLPEGIVDDDLEYLYPGDVSKLREGTYEVFRYPLVVDKVTRRMMPMVFKK